MLAKIGLLLLARAFVKKIRLLFGGVVGFLQ